MKCRNPYTKGGMAFPCGQCMPCRINRRRVWTHRLMLERSLHGDASFITLTYNNDPYIDPRTKIPLENMQYSVSPITGELRPTLVPKHLQDWFKRIRKEYAPQKIRYYAVGEYGDDTERPHYHVAAFGYPQCRWGISRYSSSRQNCCSVCDMVRDTWGRGNVLLGELSTESAQYVAGYVTKKMTSSLDSRLDGRHPEFARISNRPGIGHDFMEEVASSILSLNLEEREADVPSALRHGSRLLPLGRYLRRKLRVMIGRDEKTPQEILNQLFNEMQPLRDIAQILADEDKTVSYGQAFKNEIIKASDQAVLNMENRAKIFKQRKTL